MNLSKFKTIEVHISTIEKGDTIMHADGKISTICQSNIKNGFCGVTLFGDSYNAGTILVKKLTLKK